MRYFAFAYNTYYPAGGWDDLIGTFDTEIEALEAIANIHPDPDNWSIVDSTFMVVVRRG